MYYVSKRMEIAGCHKLRLSYESKCSNMHGHNWIVTVYCRARRLNRDGMVIDFKHVKENIHGYLDHGNFNKLLPFNPTAENIAKWIVDQIPECYKATVQESEGNIAVYCEEPKIKGNSHHSTDHSLNNEPEELSTDNESK